MEDLVECSVCLEMYKTSGDKIPRVFPCQHTFCHSCIESMESRNRISCPICRHRHKCIDASRLPRNLTLLKILELEKNGKFDEQTQCNNTRSVEKGIQCKYVESKSKAIQWGSTTFKYCAKCQENTVFCQTCCDGNLRMCKACFQYHLYSELESVETLLNMTEGLHDTIAEVENHWKQADAYLKDLISDIKDDVGKHSGYSYEIQVITEALLESNTRDFKANICLLHDATHRSDLFGTRARGVIRRLRNCFRKCQLSCSMAIELAYLKRECEFYLNENAQAKAVGFWKSYIGFENLKKLGRDRINGPREEPMWYKWNQATKNLTFYIQSLIALFIAGIMLHLVTSADSWFRFLLWPALILCIIGIGLKCRKVIECDLSTIPPVYNRKEDGKKLEEFIEKFDRYGRQTILQGYFSGNLHFPRWSPFEASKVDEILAQRTYNTI